MLKVHSLKDRALNRGAGLLLRRHVWKRKASRQLQGSVGRCRGEALMDRWQQEQREEPHVLMEPLLFINQSVGPSETPFRAVWTSGGGWDAGGHGWKGQ